jgi:hypothetical protein
MVREMDTPITNETNSTIRKSVTVTRKATQMSLSLGHIAEADVGSEEGAEHGGHAGVDQQQPAIVFVFRRVPKHDGNAREPQLTCRSNKLFLGGMRRAGGSGAGGASQFAGGLGEIAD